MGQSQESQSSPHAKARGPNFPAEDAGPSHHGAPSQDPEMLVALTELSSPQAQWRTGILLLCSPQSAADTIQHLDLKPASCPSPCPSDWGTWMD